MLVTDTEGGKEVVVVVVVDDELNRQKGSGFINLTSFKNLLNVLTCSIVELGKLLKYSENKYLVFTCVLTSIVVRLSYFY